MDIISGFIKLFTIFFVAYVIYELTTPSKPLKKKPSKRHTCISCGELLQEDTPSICVTCELHAGEE